MKLACGGAAALALLGALAGCARREAAPPPPLVRSAIVRAASGSAASFTGVIRAHRESELGFRVAGKIVARLVEPGQAVRRGQPLMRLDASDYSLAAGAAQAAVAEAAAENVRTQADLARIEPLIARGFVSRSAVDSARAAADEAAARLRSAQANARSAGNKSGYATLFADADGIVMSVDAEIGQVVTEGQPIVRFAYAGDRDAVVAIPEAMRGRAGLPATATAYGSDRAVPVRLRSLAAAADPATRTYEAHYALPEGAPLPLGTTVTVSLFAPGAAATVSVPLGALVAHGGGSGVWRLRPDRTVAFAPVRVVQLGEEDALVAGVPAGVRIVALGASFLRQGEAVRLAPDTGAR